MPLTLICGWRGSGKTLFALVINLLFSNRIIYSNFKINHTNYRPLKLLDLIRLPKHIELILDEGYAIIDSRISMSYINVYSGYLAFQLRKTDRNIYITVQQLSSIDKRYRNEWDYFVECSRLYNGNVSWKKWDFNYIISDKRAETITNWIITYENATKFFGLYDTNEIIQPRNKSRIEYEFLKDEPEELWRVGLTITERIVRSIKSKKITKEIVEIALLKNGIDPIWKTICYLVLKDAIK